MLKPMTRFLCAALALAGALAAAACLPGRSSNRPPPARMPPASGEAGIGRAEAFAGGLVVQPFALLLTDFDATGDRRVTPAELEAGVAAAWRELDRDGDGSASALEFADWSRAAMGSDNTIPGRVAFDRDASGTISRSEFEAQIGQEFARLDADRNGVVERAEMVRLVEPGAAMRGGPGAGREVVRRRVAGPR
jgi:Ca2+-binding EF-hand superfamily protein